MLFSSACIATVLSWWTITMTAHALSFQSADLTAGQVADLTFTDRIYVPYGPDRLAPDGVDPDTQPWTGYGYGTGATEHWAYDHVEKYVYSQGETGGYITVIDYAQIPPQVSTSSFAVPSADNVDIRDIVVCPSEGLLFVSVSDQQNVLIYETVKRSGGQATLLKELDVGNTPDALKLSNDCATLAVANQNEGTSILTQGALTLITDFRTDNPTVRRVLLNGQDDTELLSRDVELPISRDSISYWAVQHGEPFVTLQNEYDPALGFDPEFIAFNNDGSKIYLNLQENSALAVIDVASASLDYIDGYGLKSFTSGDGVDIVDDKQCRLYTNPCLYLARRPDGIDTVEIDGRNYVLTGDEGSDFSIGNDDQEWEEKIDSQDLFTTAGGFAFPDFTFGGDLNLTDPDGCVANFNADCDEATAPGGWCSNFEMLISPGVVDYSGANPVMDKIVGIGGRGIAIFEVRQNDINFIWDSASDFERETCDNNFAWANNAVQDEDFAPVQGTLWQLADDDDRESIEETNDPAQDGCTFNDGTSGACPMAETIDAKAQEDGLAVETVTVGEACGSLLAVGCGENNGMCLLYDISNIASPQIIKTFNLSPASRSKNPEQSYRDDMGDLDPETTIFVPKEESPTGCAGVIFGGAISGTLSFYEFVCVGGSKDCTDIVVEKDDDGLSSGAIAGIAIGAAVGAIIVLFLFFKCRKGSESIDKPIEGDGDYA